jgi:hypothetical protein
VHAAVPWVLAVIFVIADRSSDLAGFEVAAEYRARRDAGRPVEVNPLFHKNVYHAAGEHAPHGAAFHNQSALHISNHPLKAILIFRIADVLILTGSLSEFNLFGFRAAECFMEFWKAA